MEESLMTARTRKILDEALKLPDRERADLATQLWNSLDEDDWEDEIEKRAKDMREGKVKGVPIDEALAQLGKRRHGTSSRRVPR
jgi:putative addiction module component (TIGR02574 family)